MVWVDGSTSWSHDPLPKAASNEARLGQSFENRKFDLKYLVDSKSVHIEPTGQPDPG